MKIKRALAAVKQKPENVEAWVTLARELRAAGRLSEARESYERALALDPTQEELYEELWSLDDTAVLPDWVDELHGELKGVRRVKEAHEVLQGRAPSPAGSITPQSARLLVGIALASIFFLLGGLGLTAMLREGVALDAPRAAQPADPLGQTTQRAVPLGEGMLLDDGLRLTILGTPDPAGFQIRYYTYYDNPNEREFRNDGPPPGLRPFIVRAEVENVAAGAEKYLHIYGMSLVDSEGVSYDEACGILADELDDTGKLARGERTEGVICILVQEGAEVEYLAYTPSYDSGKRYFALTPR